MNTIRVKKYSDIIEEYPAAAAITPGMLVTKDPETLASRASLFVLDDDGIGLKFTAKKPGADGNDISIEITDEGSVQIAVDGNSIEIGINEDTTSFDTLYTALVADEDVYRLVSIEKVGATAADAVVLDETYLVGGADAIGVKPHAGGNVLTMVALEDDLRGKTIAQAYAQSDPVQVWIPRRGDQVYGLLTGAAVAIGDYLQSAGDGTFKKYDEDDIAYASLAVVDGDGNGLLFTSRLPGVEGNGISIAIQDDSNLDVSVDGKEISIDIDLGTSSFANVKAAIEADEAAHGLVVVTTIESGADCIEMFETALSGGKGVAPLQIVGQALEAKNPNGQTVRVKARIA